MIKIIHMRTSWGRNARNQYIIDTGKERIFQSYDTIVAKKKNGVTYLDEKYWHHSNTSSKYRNQFLGEGIKEIRRNIINGTYKLVDLNKE